jgi:hypothetical protein
MADIAFRSATSIAMDPASTSWIGNKPSGTADGDLLIAQLGADRDLSVTTAPSGWTLLHDVLMTTTADVEMWIYYKIAASEGASWTWTMGSSFRGTVGIAAYQNVDQTTPIDTSDFNPQTASGTSHATPSITPSVANCMLCAFYLIDVAANSWTEPSGMTERWDVTPHPNSSQSAMMADVLHTTGAVSKTATSSGTDNAVTALVALKPGSGGGAAPVVATRALLGMG